MGRSQPRLRVRGAGRHRQREPRQERGDPATRVLAALGQRHGGVVTDVSGVAIDLPVGVEPAIAAFIYLEARLADEARYTEWEALWDDDARYWVPRHEGADPDAEVSYIYD